ncbi:caspase, EACC1-associated type [Tolypothrix sp. VBCCA 56010]|uniref:caspase, EACC1-associated type n=1 Tax=Tolypothrix sp. VBCCA 56010 TaxID=3137731 RepID=UPI003D7D3FAE
MGKFALLIGVSKYDSPNLCELQKVENDVQEMARVLLHPEMCGFAEENIQCLPNPDLQTMREAIHNLFDKCKKDDLVLLYLAGHGLKNKESGDLYFATTRTREDAPFATAVEASFVHRVMSDSRSKRQVVILDCCYSGAFSHGMLARSPNDINVKVNIEEQLGGEGRAVLTSSTSLQPTLDGVYTSYLVEGIETGAADENGNGEISIGELHNYAKKQVKISAPSMEPEIYTTKEGYAILLAQAPKGKPELKYRKKVEELAESAEHCNISRLGRRTLERLRKNLGLSPEETDAIETEVLKPCRDRENNLKEYEELFRQEINDRYPLPTKTCQELKIYQQHLGLRDEDVEPIKKLVLDERLQKVEQYKQNYHQAVRDNYPVNQETHAQLRQSSGLCNGDINEIEQQVLEERQQGLNQYRQNFHQAVQDNYPVNEQTHRQLRQSSGLCNGDINEIEQQVLEERQQGLNQYRQNFHQAVQDNYPVNEQTHRQLRQSSGLCNGDINEIEQQVLEERRQGLNQYKQELNLAIRRGYPILNRDNTDYRLRLIQQNLGLSNRDIQNIKSRLISQAIILWLLIGFISILIIIYIIFLIISADQNPTQNPTLITTTSPTITPKKSDMKDNPNISLGEKYLFKNEPVNTKKQEAIDNFKSGRYQIAAEKFQEDRDPHPNNPKGSDKHLNDPEALIYKNNAEAAANENFIIIAVSVPIGTNPSVAKEILRGVAQAQDEVNHEPNANRIQGKWLQVVIANDDNDPNLATQVAREFVNPDNKILAVVGHNDAKASMAGADVYNKNQKVMISPTTFAGNLSRQYVFVIFPPISDFARHVAEEIKKASNSQVPNILICVDSDSNDNNEFANDLRIYVSNQPPQNMILNNTPCDLSNIDDKISDSYIQNIFSQASGSNTLLLAPSVNRIEKAIRIARVNKTQPNPLPVWSSPTMNTYLTVEKQNGSHVEGMKMPVPWNPADEEGDKFLGNARKLWDGDVNWRSAMAYDATNAIIRVLKQNGGNKVSPTEIRELSFKGATGTIDFKGSRELSVSLLEVQKNPQNKEKEPYIFKPL